MRSASNPADVFPSTSGRFHAPVHCACVKILSERGLLQITAMLAEICQGIFLSWVPSLEEFGQNVFVAVHFFHIMCTYSKPGAFIFILIRRTSI